MRIRDFPAALDDRATHELKEQSLLRCYFVVKSENRHIRRQASPVAPIGAARAVAPIGADGGASR